jgi:hypothetical protein
MYQLGGNRELQRAITSLVILKQEAEIGAIEI